MNHLVTFHKWWQNRQRLLLELGNVEHARDEALEEVDRLHAQSYDDATIIRSLERELAGCKEFLKFLGGMVAAEGES